MKKEDPVSEKKNDTEAKISQSTSTKSTATTTTTNIPRVPTNFNLFSNMIPTINTLPTEQKSVVE